MATILDRKLFELQISRMPEGGFVVLDGYRRDCDDFRGPRFASTSIDDALEYCKRKLETEHGEVK